MTSTIKLFPSNKKMDPFNPKPEDFCIDDIAHGLSRNCRYNGHVAGFLSVAEHCVIVSRILEDEWGLGPEIALQGLLHDGYEAYISDLSRPVKYRPEMAGYREAELRGEAVMAEAFGIAFPFHPKVKEADIEAYNREVSGPAPLRERPMDESIGPEQARIMFLARFVDLVLERAFMSPTFRRSWA